MQQEEGRARGLVKGTQGGRGSKVLGQAGQRRGARASLGVPCQGGEWKRQA